MGDRRESITSYQFPMVVQETGPEDFVVSPDATDGIGSIEFTKEEDSSYYGMSTWIRGRLIYAELDLISSCSRPVFQHCIHTEYSTRTLRTAIPARITPTRLGIKAPSAGCSASAITRCIPPFNTSQEAIEALHRRDSELRGLS